MAIHEPCVAPSNRSLPFSSRLLYFPARHSPPYPSSLTPFPPKPNSIVEYDWLTAQDPDVVAYMQQNEAPNFA